MFEHDRRQVVLLAQILTTKHGVRATEVAADRARLWTDAGDEVTASLWTEVGEVIAMGRRAATAPLIPPKTPPRMR
jgi:hypothetical protein